MISVDDGGNRPTHGSSRLPAGVPSLRSLAASEVKLLSRPNPATTRQSPGNPSGIRPQSGRAGLDRPAARRDKPSPMPRYDFRTPRLFVDAPLAEGAALALEPRAGELSGQRAAARSRRRRAGVQRARRRVARAPRRRGQEARSRLDIAERMREQTRAARPALPVRAAQARAPRLHGAEGGRDGRLAAAAGDHAAHPGRARQSRAHARERDRGGRAMRHPQRRRRSPSRSKLEAFDARLDAGAAAGVLRRGCRREGPGRGARGRARRRHRRTARRSAC